MEHTLPKKDFMEEKYQKRGRVRVRGALFYTQPRGIKALESPRITLLPQIGITKRLTIKNYVFSIRVNHGTPTTAVAKQLDGTAAGTSGAAKYCASNNLHTIDPELSFLHLLQLNKLRKRGRHFRVLLRHFLLTQHFRSYLDRRLPCDFQ